RRCSLDVFNYEFLCLPLENNRAPKWQVREIIFDFLLNWGSCLSDKCSKLAFEIIFWSRIANEIQYCETFLTISQSQPSSKLLQENGQAFRWTKKQDRITFWNI